VPFGPGSAAPGVIAWQPTKKVYCGPTAGCTKMSNRGAPAPQWPSVRHQNSRCFRLDTGCPSNPLMTATPAAKVGVEVSFWK
jgi:hypothetical protein